MDDKPFLGVPGGEVRIEDPDGVLRTGFDGPTGRHNLRDTGEVCGGVYDGRVYGAFIEPMTLQKK